MLDAARARFGSDGYERATIRSIAAEAGVDPALVIRHFGSKDQLFAAATEIDLRLPDLTQVERDRVGETLVRHAVARWEADEPLQVLLRTASTNVAAATRLQEIFAGQLVPMLRQISPDPDQAPTRAGLVATQVLGFALCRWVLRLPPVAAMSTEDACGWLGPTVQRYVVGEV